MHQFLILTLLLAFFYPLAQTQECLSDSGQPQVDFLQTGTYTIVNQNYQRTSAPTQQTCYDIPLSYNPPSGKSFSLILSPIQISSQQSLVADFSIRSSKRERSFSLIVVSSLRSWLSYTVSYLLTSRDDLMLGNFIFNAFESIPCGNVSNEIQTKYLIPNWKSPFATNQNVTAKLFLSGIRNIPTTNGTFLSMGIKSASVNTSNGEISFVLSNPNRNTYLTLQFNFILISQVSFKYDLEDISFTGSGMTTRQNFRTAPLYFFGGVSSYNSQKASNNGFSITSFTQTVVSCRGSRCRRSCVSRRQCDQRQGRLLNNSRGNIQCLLDCGANEALNSSNQCECLQGFQRRNGTCTAMVPLISCSGSDIYNFTTRRCECGRSFALSPTGGCRPRCNTNGYINSSNQCQCLPGFRMFENIFCHNCQQRVDSVNRRCTCIEPQFYQALNGSCVKNPCTSNYHFFVADNKCRCPDTQVDVNGTCYNTCGANQYILRASCTCMPGFTLVRERNGCFQRVTCTKQNQTPDQTGYDCICRDGFERDRQTNACVIKCPAGQVLSFNKQTCECQQGFVRDPSTRQCRDNCGTNQIYDRNVFSCRCRDGHVRDSAMACVLQTSSSVPRNCNANEEFSESSQNCVCIRGFERTQQGLCQPIQSVQPTQPVQPVPPRICPSNSTLRNNECVCNAGFMRMGEVCTSICGINEVYNEQSAACECRQGFGRVTNVCRVCPQNSTTRNSSCFCSMGLRWVQETNTCDITCQPNSVRTLITLSNSQNVWICQCLAGFVQNVQGQCIKIPDPVCPPAPIQPPVTPPQNTISCPGTSVWDSVNFRCFCNSSSLFFINGNCRACDANQGWNGSSCACLTGFNFINSKCLRCDINSVFRSGKCNCNFGFYDQNPAKIQNTSCKPCHASCGTCSGPLNRQCLTCYDPEDQFAAGRCTANRNCPRGFFNSTSGCQKCSEYCRKCKNENECTDCVAGFSIEKVNIFGIASAFCPQICGDGKRFEYECDDGNVKDGDGCDSGCFIEKGWTCNAGSPTSASVCIKSQQTRAILTITKPLRMIGQINQGVTLSHIPEALSENLCLKCDDILLVRLISYKIQPQVKVNYIPTTRFKFTMSFTFSGIFAIPDFVYSLQINPKYEKFFTAEDMAQILVIPVVPADLALNNDEDTLSLDELMGPVSMN